MKIQKRLLALVLSLAMVITSLTVTAFAADDYIEVSTAAEYHAAFTGTAKIRLMADITCTKQEVAGANEDVTLDLNGHTLTGYAGTRIYYTTQTTAKFTIEDSVGTGKVIANNGSSYTNAGAIIYTQGSITINGGTFSGETTTGKGAAIYVTGASGCVAINGGRLEDAGTGTALIYVNGAAKCYVSGGYIGNTSGGSSIWAYTASGTKAEIHITGDPIITASSTPSSTYFKTLTGGYYAKNMSSYITDTANYKQITLPTAKEGCQYKVTKNDATIKYYDGENEYEALAATISAGTTAPTAAAQTKEGYNFVSWNTKADGTGDNYPAATDFFVEGDLDLYAQWIDASSETVDIKYFDGDTEYSTLAETIEKGTSFTTEPAQSKEGYTFKEWNTSKDGDGTSYAPGQEYQADSNITLYAQWESIVACVTVGGEITYYGSFANALSAVIAGTADASEGTIKLMADLNVTDRINFSSAAVTSETIKRTTNFDLNGYTITSGSTSGFAALNKYSKLNILDSSTDGSGAVIMTASANQYIYSPGWTGTQVKIYGGSYTGAAKICNYSNNSNNACRVYGGNYDVSPLAYIVTGESGFEQIGSRYYVGVAAVTVDNATKVFGDFDSAISYLVNNNDAGETGTIELLANIAVSSRILLYKTWSSSNAKRTVYFDLNGFTLSSTKALSGGIITQNCYDVTYIQDTSEAKTGKIAMYEGSGYYFHTPRYTTNKYYISDVTLTGGSQIGPDNAISSSTYYETESGTYNFDPSAYITDPTRTALNNGDGTWTIIDAPYIVTYSDETSEYFATYELARDAILNRADMTGEIKIATDKPEATFALNDSCADITLNLNGQTVSMAGNTPFADVQAGKLTIKNGTIDLTDKTGDAAKIQVAAGSILCLDQIEFAGETSPVIISSGIVSIDGVVTTSGVVEQSGNEAVLDTISGTVSADVVFTVNALVAADEEDAVVTMKYVTDGKTIEVAGTSLGGGRYQFITNTGILLVNFDEDLQLQIFVNGEAVSSAATVSVQSYFDTVYSLYPDKHSQNAFMAEALEFAQKLQIAKNGEATIVLGEWAVNNLIDSAPKSSDNRKAVLSAAVSPTTDKVVTAYANVSNKVRIIFLVRSSVGTRVEVTLGGVTVYNKVSTTGGEKEIILDKISPLEYDSDYIVTLYNSDSEVLYKIRYSVNSYAYSLNNRNVASDAVKAMYRYGVAAEAVKTDADVVFNDPSYIWSIDNATCTYTRVSADGSVTQTETVTATKETVVEGSGVVASVVKSTADFVNPSIPTQVVTAPAVKAANITGDKTQTAYDKHLILNDDNSYGGSYDEATYGAGAPLNGANDNPNAGYYAINDYYNTKCTDTRTILTGFAPYQQTMADTDGIASILMAMNYYGESYTEKELLDKYEALNATTVYNNGTTATGLKKVVESYGFSADATATVSSAADFATLVTNSLQAGKIVLVRYQQADKARWAVVIGYDNMGNESLNSDPLILATPYDAYDHYQDGYQVAATTVFYKWWREQSHTGSSAQHEILIIDPKSPIQLQTSETDNIKTNPFYAERHLLLNSDGTFGGEMDNYLYGFGTAQNGTYMNGSNYEYMDAPEYNYFGKADYYNLVDTSSLKICENFSVFQQNMASSCGISSTLNTLNYLGYDFTKLDNYVEDRPTQSSYEVGMIHTGENYDRVQEALVNIYMQGDTYFNDSTKRFNDYGGVGASKLVKIGDKLGLSATYGNFSVSSSATANFATFDAFKTFIQGRLDQNLPTIICWAPSSGHWETIIGYDDMGTASTDDDVIVLADSADSHDQYQDGYNTYPAKQFYGQWYNGSYTLGQARVMYSAIN